MLDQPVTHRRARPRCGCRTRRRRCVEAPDRWRRGGRRDRRRALLAQCRPVYRSPRERTEPPSDRIVALTDSHRRSVPYERSFVCASGSPVSVRRIVSSAIIVRPDVGGRVNVDPDHIVSDVRRRRCVHHAQPARQAQCVHRRDARGLPNGSGARRTQRFGPGSPHHRRRPGILRRPGSVRSCRRPRQRPTGSRRVARTSLQPHRPADRGHAQTSRRCRQRSSRRGREPTWRSSGDIVIAARSARFIQSFARIGLVPDSGGTYFLPRALGTARATGLALLGEALPAERAAEWGLIWQVVDDGELSAAARHDGCALAAGPTAGYAKIKQAHGCVAGAFARRATRPRA